MKIVFMGTPDFAVPSLKALAHAGYTVAAVVARPDRPKGRGGKVSPPPVKECALSLGLPVHQPERLKDPSFLGCMSELSPDAVVVVAYGKILPREILSLPGLGCINVHASLLPGYRGSAPIHRAVINGESETGVTTMYMEEGLDTGDIIQQKRVAIGEDDTAGVVHDRLSVLGASLLTETLALIAKGGAPRVPQDGSLATYAPPLTAEDEIICWNATARSIKDRVRGLNPWPGARTYLGERLVKVWRVRVADGYKPAGRPGTVLAFLEEGIRVQAGEGQIIITELQAEGSKRMSAAEFLRGAKQIRCGDTPSTFD
ncbi:MAG: methionyl-tRNA formyltransferase [Eubacteriales bacterium]